MTGLRARQKADRSRRILDAARQRFQNEGYDAVTIDSIAAAADVSSVTVYNYYGAKPGLLLALVKESDERLIAKLRSLIEGEERPLLEQVARFAQILRWHALSYLSKATWRHVLAASIVEGSGSFGRGYRELDEVLADLMVALVERQTETGLALPAAGAKALGETLFDLQNMHFFHFIADDAVTDRDVDARLRRNLGALFAAGSQIGAGDAASKARTAEG